MSNNACLINKVYLVNKIYKLLGPTTVHSNICLASLLFLTLLSFSCLDKLNHTKNVIFKKRRKKCDILYHYKRIRKVVGLPADCIYGFYVCMCTTSLPGACRGHRGSRLSGTGGTGALLRRLKAEPGSSARSTSVLSCCSISPAPPLGS